MFTKRMVVFLVLAGLVAFAGGCAKEQTVDTTPSIPEPVDEPEVVEEVVDEPDTDEMDMAPPSLEDVFFAFDKYNLSAEARSSLQQNADELKRVTDAKLLIEGHCDERGTKSYNLALGEKRANAAKDYLVQLGISASRIETISYGKERPFAMGHNEAAWAKNRRAHMVVTMN